MANSINADDNFSKKVRINFIFSIIAFFELVSASFVTLTFEPDQKNAWLLGYSLQRWALMLFSLFVAISIIVAGKMAFNKKVTFASFIQMKVNIFGQRLLAIVTFLLVLWGWCSIFCPAYLFGEGASYFERLRPLSIVIGLVLLQFYLLSLFSNRKINLLSLKSIIKQDSLLRASIFFAACLITLSVFIGITKIGLVQQTPYWNVPGIPLSGLQLLAVILIITLGMYFLPKGEQSASSTKLTRFYRYLPILIYVGAVLVWGLTPMLKHYFSLQPTPPNNQPFPFSDARNYDTASISIIKGESNIFHKSTDKPLYIVFLAFLHLFAGNNYSFLVWLQIVVLAFIPVILYFFGKQFYSQGFGVFLALVSILQQRNAIVLSYTIASVNPKLLVTEVMVLLGVVLFAYLVFLWFRTPKYWLALLSGGVIGASSLIRLNPIILFPAIACLALVALPKFPINKWKHLALYTVGFLILFIPWLFTGVHTETGIPWALEKPITVISNRYLVKPVVNTPEFVTPVPTPGFTQTPIQLSPSTGVSPAGRSVSKQAPVQGSISAVISKSVSFVVRPGFKQVPVQLLTSTAVPKSEATPLVSQGTVEKKNRFSDLFINHFLHNFSTSLLSLPDSLMYDDLFHLAQREYWIDLNQWQGDFPPAQILLIFLNLTLISVGLGYSWQKYRWIGLLPLVIFISYAISLGLVVNSGSRYIVPIDWILYFYYGLAIVILIRRVTNFIRGEKKSLLDPIKNDSLQPSSDRKRFWLSFAGLAIAASLLPIANLGLPLISSGPKDNVQLDALVNSIPVNQKSKARIIYGEIIYPYYKGDGTLDFDFMVNYKITRYTINLNQKPLKVTLNGGEFLFLVTRPENGKYVVKSIYMETESTLTLIWDLDSKP